MKKRNNLFKGIFCILTSAVILLFPLSTNAADITVESYVEGGLIMTLHGDWSKRLIFEDVSTTLQEHTTSWVNINDSYIAFADDTDIPGFHIIFSMTDFEYSGQSSTQTAIPAENFNLLAKDNKAPTIGFNDPSFNLSILPASCSEIQNKNFSFNTDFLDQKNNFSIKGSKSGQIIIESNNNCIAVGELRFNKATTTIPKDSAIGKYHSSLVFTIVDGPSDF